MDLLRWDENWRWFVFHINDHQWHPLLCIVIQIDLWSTLWVLVFLHPFQFMPIGLMNKVDIMSGTQHFPPLKFLSDYLHSVQFSSVQSLSRVWLFVTPWTTGRQASLSITNSQSPPKPMSIVGDAIQPSHPLFSPSPPPTIFPSIRIFSKESVLRIRWPKYWGFIFSISPSIDYSGLISFRMDWLDLLAVQGSLKCLLQHRSSKSSVPWHSAFFMVQLSHPYVTTGNTIALTIGT